MRTLARTVAPVELTLRRIQETAKAVVEGKVTPEQATDRFSRSPGAQEVRQWAADYRLLDAAKFEAKYGTRRGSPGRIQPGEFNYDDVVGVLRKSIAGLEGEEQRLEEQIEAVRSKLE